MKKNKVIIGLIVAFIVCVIIALVIRRQEVKTDEISDFMSEESNELGSITVEEAEEYEQEINDKQQAFYKNLSNKIILSNYDKCNEIDPSFEVVAGVDIDALDSYQRLVSALAEKYSVECTQIIFDDIEYDEESMTFANIINIGDEQIKVYLDEEVAYIAE